MSKQKLKTTGFGAPEDYGAHVFRVLIPRTAKEPVTIVEHFGYKGGHDDIPEQEDRVTLSREAWNAIAPTARTDFNDRLRTSGSTGSRWKVGDNLVDRLLGKELCVLAWAAEHAPSDEWAVICSKWVALRPEERWWLFSMTASEAGHSSDSERGWRKALYCALSDGERFLRPEKRRKRPPNDNGQSELPLFVEEADD